MSDVPVSPSASSPGQVLGLRFRGHGLMVRGKVLWVRG